jgi:uncharacterized protein
LLPEPLLAQALPPNALRPSYLDLRDHLWLSVLIEEYERFAGRRAADLDARLREPLRVPCAADRLRRARHVMDRLCGPRLQARVAPAKVREALFLAAAGREPRSAALAQATCELACSETDLLACLFADLPGERVLPPPPEGLDPGELALRVNLALVQGLLARATAVTVTITGNARDIVRYAKLRGLLCVARTAPPEVACGATLEISGPLALFHRTRVYGSALASLVPRLSWCDRFELSAECLLAGETRVLRVRSGDPIFPAERPPRFDSALEQRFAKDFARAAPDWELIREPVAVQVGHRLIFPDFGLVHRRDPSRQALLEIVGFWSPAYRAEKLARLREAHVDSLILCIDDKHSVTADELPPSARVVRYRRRIRPEAVLDILEG